MIGATLITGRGRQSRRSPSKLTRLEASEQKELADVNARLAANAQKLDKQKQKLQSSEAKEAGNALRLIQQQHVAAHLRAARISSATIPGIGPGIVSSLAMNGITSAADFTGLYYETGPRGGQQVFISLRNGTAVHPSGVGEKKARDLDNWRRRIERAAMATQPSSLPAAQAQAIRTKYTLQRQALADQEKAARVQAASEQNQIRQRWAQTNTAISTELADTRRTFAQERAQADLQLVTAQKQANTATWQRELAEREIAAYRNVNYRRYIAGVIRT